MTIAWGIVGAFLGALAATVAHALGMGDWSVPMGCAGALWGSAWADRRRRDRLMAEAEAERRRRMEGDRGEAIVPAGEVTDGDPAMFYELPEATVNRLRA